MIAKQTPAERAERATWTWATEQTQALWCPACDKGLGYFNPEASPHLVMHRWVYHSPQHDGYYKRAKRERQTRSYRKHAYERSHNYLRIGTEEPYGYLQLIPLADIRRMACGHCQASFDVARPERPG